MRVAAARNLLKVWVFLPVLVGGLGLLGWFAGGYRLLSTVVFCSLLAAAAAYWYADRVVMGMVGASRARARRSADRALDARAAFGARGRGEAEALPHP